MVRRLGRRDLLWVALISGAFALLTVQVVIGMRGYDRPPPGVLWRVLGAPGISLGWGGVALLLVAIPYALLAWMRGRSPGKTISAIGALVLALGVGGVAAVLAVTPKAGGGVLGGGLGGMLKEALGPGLATALLGLICLPGLLLALAPVVLEARGLPSLAASTAATTASVLGSGHFAPAAIPVAPGVRTRYPERRLGPDGEELPMEFTGADVGAVKFREPVEPGAPPPAPEVPTARVTLSPPATVGPAAKKQKPIAGVRYADEPNTPVTDPVEARESPKEPEAPAEAGLPFGVRYSAPLIPAAPPPAVSPPADTPPAAAPPPPEPAPALPDVSVAPAPAPVEDLPPEAAVVLAPTRAVPVALPPPEGAAPVASSPPPPPPPSSVATPGLAASVSLAAAGLRAALDTPRPSKTSETLADVISDRTSAPRPLASAPGAAPEAPGDVRTSSSEYRRKLASTGMFDSARAAEPRPVRPLKPRPRLARPDSLQDAIRGLFSSLPLEELPPVATLDEPEPPAPEPRVDAPGQTVLFEVDPKTGKPTRPAAIRPARHAATSDPLYPQALQAAKERGSASLVMLKRTLGVGYARAAGLMDALVAEGVLGEMTASGSRPVEGSTRTNA